MRFQNLENLVVFLWRFQSEHFLLCSPPCTEEEGEEAQRGTDDNNGGGKADEASDKITGEINQRDGIIMVI